MADPPGYEFTRCKVADRGGTAQKRIVGKDDGTYETFGYDHVTNWFFDPWRVSGNAGMAAFLRKVAVRPDLMLVMGAVRPGLDLRKPQLRRWVDADPRKNTLADTPRAWLAVDVDGYGVPAPWGLADRLANAAACVRDDALGEEFTGVECVVTATAKTGLVGEEMARLRLFFQLDQAHPLADLERWAVGARAADLPVDPVVFRAGQPIYTARPRFEGALRGRDPVPPHLRAFVLPAAKAGDVSVALDIHRYDQLECEIAEHMRNAGTHCGGDWRALMQATVGGPASFYTPLTQALGLAARSSENDAAIADYVATLLAERADPGRQGQYGTRWVLDTLRRFRKKDNAAGREIEALRGELFVEDRNNATG